MSMPSTGFFHFYRKMKKMFGLFLILCQCPQRASFISTQKPAEPVVFEGVCQCPQRASFISTKRHLKEEVRCWVSCPQRASFISTVPSGNPHKHWAPGPVFAGICLNILKTTVFEGFSVLFTICSYLHAPCLPLLYFTSPAKKSPKFTSPAIYSSSKNTDIL